VLQAIEDTKVNMTVWLGVYVDVNETAYNVQLAAVKDAIKTYGTAHISGVSVYIYQTDKQVTVGNEYILNTAGTDSLTSSTYRAAVKDITDRVASVKTALDGMGLDKTLPVGTSDAGSILSTTLASGIDYFMANVHP
jgi:glucan 1,3-beta-glucosidase